MLKWLKDEVVRQLLADVQRNAKRYDVIIEMLRSQANVAADVALIKDELSTIHQLTFELTGKVETLMATQEERLQAILVAVKSVKQMLAELKANNPAIEDEISAIEAELAPATEPPATGTEV